MNQPLLDNLKLQQIAVQRIIDLTSYYIKNPWHLPGKATQEGELVQWVKTFDALQRIEMALAVGNPPEKFRQKHIDKLLHSDE